MAQPAKPLEPEKAQRKTGGKRGRPTKEEQEAKKAQEELEAKFKPLTPDEEEIFVTALGYGYDLLDTMLWHTGLDTDPQVPKWPPEPIYDEESGEYGLMGGKPIWHVERETLMAVHLPVFRRQAKRFPIMNAQARVLIDVMDYYQLGLITVRQVWETIVGFMDNGLHPRLTSKEAFIRKVNETVYNGNEEAS